MSCKISSLALFCAAMGLTQTLHAESLSPYRYQSLQVATPGLTDRYLRHFNGLGATEAVNGSSDIMLKQDATYRVLPGLADANCFSFESRNFPGHFLRHRDFRLRNEVRDWSPIFSADATFCARKALDGSDNISLESKNMSGYYIRHRNAEVWLDALEDSTGYKEDATWHVANAWARSEVNLNMNSLQSFRVSIPGLADRYLRHYQGLGFTEHVDGGSNEVLKQDATYRIVVGRADNSCYSFESKNFPGHFLRHSASRIRLDAADDSPLFNEDATFCAQRGLGGTGVSFQSYNYPNRYIRHAFGEVWISSADESVVSPETKQSFRADASWDISGPWWP